MSRVLPFIMLCLFISCKKSLDDLPQNEQDIEKKEESRLKPCDCNAKSIEYIKAEFNGIKMCFDEQWTNPTLFTNAHIYNPALPQDQLNLIRQNTDRSFTASFFFTNSRIHQRTMPYVLPHDNLEFCELAEFQLLDHTAPYASACQFCPEDSTDYIAYTGQNLKISITDTTYGFLKGTFEGVMATRTGKTLTIKNGAFNIKVTRVKTL